MDPQTSFPVDHGGQQQPSHLQQPDAPGKLGTNPMGNPQAVAPIDKGEKIQIEVDCCRKGNKTCCF